MPRTAVLALLAIACHAPGPPSVVPAPAAGAPVTGRVTALTASLESTPYTTITVAMTSAAAVTCTVTGYAVTWPGGHADAAGLDLPLAPGATLARTLRTPLGEHSGLTVAAASVVVQAFCPRAEAPRSKDELGAYAASPEARAIAAEGARRVATLRARLPGMPPEDLIAALFTSPPGTFAAPAGADAYLWRDGNLAIEEELARRGGNARPALAAHRDDPAQVFTGFNGPQLTVGQLCARRLLALPASTPATAPR
jgi:hypothetical protein